MPFETRQVDGKDVQYYVAPSKELPTVLNSKPIETSTATQEPVPFDSSDELNVFNEGEFSGFDWNSGFDASIFEKTPQIDWSTPPPNPANEILNNLSERSREIVLNSGITEGNIDERGLFGGAWDADNQYSQQDLLTLQEELNNLRPEEASKNWFSALLHKNPIQKEISKNVFRDDAWGVAARVAQPGAEVLVDTLPTNIWNQLTTQGYGLNYQAATNWQQDTGNPWAIDFLGVGKQIWGKEIPYLNAPLPEGANRESLNSVPFWKQLLQSSTVVDSALLALIGQDSSNTPGANIDGQFLDQLQLEELGVKNFELTTRGDDAYNRQTTGSYAQLIPWNLAIPKSKVSVEELLALGYRPDQIFERYDGDHWVLGPIRPGDLMDQKGMDVNPELILKRDESGKLIDIFYGGRSYTPGLSGSTSLLGDITGMDAFARKPFDWEIDNYQGTQVQLKDSRIVQAVAEQMAAPLATYLGLTYLTAGRMNKLGIKPHFPGYAKSMSLLKTGRDMRTYSNLFSPGMLKGLMYTARGKVGVSLTEWGMASGLTGLLFDNPRGPAGGGGTRFLTEGAELAFGEGHPLTNFINVLAINPWDSHAVGNAKVFTSDAILGGALGTFVDIGGSGIRSAWNAPGFFSPRVIEAFKNLNLQRLDDFNYTGFKGGQYESIFEKFDRGLIEQFSLTNDDLRAIVTIKNEIKPMLDKVSETMVNGIRLEGLQARLARLNQLNRTDISVVKPKKSYTRGESGASQAEPGSPWRQFTETNQRKPLWETPYSEQKEIELTQNKEQLKEEVKTVEQEIVETESRLGEQAQEVEQEIVRVQESVTPPQKQSLVEQGVDPNFAPPVPSEIQKLPVAEIEVAPQYFQVKRSGREAKAGVSGSLAGAGQFEPILGGVVSVWRDRQGQIGEAGKVYIVDGHNRLDLAKR